MRAIQTILAGLLVAGLVASAQAQDQYTIQYVQFKPGEVAYQYTAGHVVGTVSGAMPGVQNMTQKFDQWQKIECLKVDEEGTATVKMTFVRIAMTMSIGPLTVKYDSATAEPGSPGYDLFNRSLGAMVGRSITGRINAKGDCIEVHGLKELVEATMADVPGAKQVLKALESAMSEDTIKQSWLGGIQWLPTKPVQMGEVWSTEQKTRLGAIGEAVVKGKSKLMAVEAVNGRRLAKVAMTTNMALGDGEGLEMGDQGESMNMKMKMTSTGGAGSWLWDLQQGRMVELKMSQPIEMTMEMQNPLKADQTMTVVQKAQVTTQIRIYDRKAGEMAVAATQPAEAPATQSSAAAKP